MIVWDKIMFFPLLTYPSGTVVGLQILVQITVSITQWHKPMLKTFRLNPPKAKTTLQAIKTVKLPTQQQQPSIQTTWPLHTNKHHHFNNRFEQNSNFRRHHIPSKRFHIKQIYLTRNPIHVHGIPLVTGALTLTSFPRV